MDPEDPLQRSTKPNIIVQLVDVRTRLEDARCAAVAPIGDWVEVRKSNTRSTKWCLSLCFRLLHLRCRSGAFLALGTPKDARVRGSVVDRLWIVSIYDTRIRRDGCDGIDV
jgi:hypothetical protein